MDKPPTKPEAAAMPDPTHLTTQQLWREVASLKELLTARIEAIEKSIEVAHEDLVRVPTDVQRQVGNLERLHDTKFDELEKRLNQRFTDTQTAITKAEVANEKRFDGIAESHSQLRDQQASLIPRTEAEKSIDSNAEKVGALATRIDRSEGRANGLFIIFIIIAAAGTLVGIFAALTR